MTKQHLKTEVDSTPEMLCKNNLDIHLGQQIYMTVMYCQ